MWVDINRFICYLFGIPSHLVVKMYWWGILCGFIATIFGILSDFSHKFILIFFIPYFFGIVLVKIANFDR